MFQVRKIPARDERLAKKERLKDLNAARHEARYQLLESLTASCTPPKLPVADDNATVILHYLHLRMHSYKKKHSSADTV